MISFSRSLLLAILISPQVVPSLIAQDSDSGPTINDGVPAYDAVTTRNPDIPIDELRILVRPLTKSELEVEAKAWFQLLRAKAMQVSAVRLGAKKVGQAMEAANQGEAQRSIQIAEKVIDAATAKAEQTEQEITDGSEIADESTQTQGDPDSQDDDESDRSSPSPESSNAETMRDELLDDVTELQSERTAISDRFEIVLDSLELKGGDVKEHRDYIYAVSGIELDTSDVASAWSGVVGWLTSKEGGQRWAWNLLRFLIILIVTWLVARLVAKMVNWLLERKIKLSQLAERLISQTIRNVVLAIGFAVALTALEIDITPIVAAIGATGLVIGLALQGTLSNFASGLMILINRPFDVGHVVTAGGVTGTIDQMNLVSTRFRTFDNQSIYVPNNEIWNNVITNITANENRRVDLEFGISYNDDFEEAENIIKDVVNAHELVLSDPEPVVVTHALADSSVNIVCRPWAKTSDWWTVKTDITRSVKKRFDQAGISIPYPQQDVHLHQVASKDPNG